MIDSGISDLEETFNKTQHNFVVDYQKYLQNTFDQRADILYAEYYKDMLELAGVQQELQYYTGNNSVDVKKDELLVAENK